MADGGKRNMRLVLLLLRASWRIVLLAGVVGGVSGAASVGLVALILHTLRDPDASSPRLIGLFAAFCAVVLLTRIGSQMLLSRLTQNSIVAIADGALPADPRLAAEAPGRDRLAPHAGLADRRRERRVAGDERRARAGREPGDSALRGGLLGFAFARACWRAPSCSASLGVASYWYSARFARQYVERAREAQDVLLKHIRELIEGVKELKMHHAPAPRVRRRRARSRPRRRSARASSSAIACTTRPSPGAGLTFFIAIGLLLFAWPKISQVDAATLTGYALTILYLMSPLEQIMGWLPFLGWATASVAQIERLGLMLDEGRAGSDRRRRRSPTGSRSSWPA